MEDLKSLTEQLPKDDSQAATLQLGETQKKAEETVEKLDYEGKTTIVTYKNATGRCNEDLINAWIYGFGEHLKAMKAANQSDLLNLEVGELGRLFNNASFAEKFSARL